MSRSEKDDVLQNPASRFFDFAGGDGVVQYYDREKKENITVNLPFKFLVLDEVFTVGGGYDDDSGFIGYWSNAIKPRFARVQPVTVRCNEKGKSKIAMTGTWAEVKANLTGAKYVKGLYIAYYNDEKKLDIGYLKVRGAALMPWVEFTKGLDITTGAFSIIDTAERKKGKNVYYEPVFDRIPELKPEVEDAALGLDRILQPYLKAYFAQNATTPVMDNSYQPARIEDGDYSGPPQEPEYFDDAPPVDDEPFEGQF